MKTSLTLGLLFCLALIPAAAKTSKSKANVTHVRQTVTKSGKTVSAYDRAKPGSPKLSTTTRTRTPRAHTWKTSK